MSRRQPAQPAPSATATPSRVRCAIYTRKSTEEGLDQEFNSLDAQREAAEAYIVSQKHQGWECLPNRYDDGGFSGANIDRPGLARLLADIAARQVDAVLVYKVDRLSRSLLDFARMMETFERHQVAFVSVTQQFNTASSMGRLILNVLLSFAQFEREMIAERTRDKMGAARRKGKWLGGRPPLGYDVAQPGHKLVVNETEAALVRKIFDLYLEERSMIRIVEILNAQGHRMKTWVTKKGERLDGNPWDKAGLWRLLSHVAYVGKVMYEGKIYPGEHPPIIDEPIFRKVERALAGSRSDRGGPARNQHGFLLRGLIRCLACGSVMTSSFASTHGKTYLYYRCTSTSRRGAASCPVGSVPAAEFERCIVERVRALAKKPELIERTLAQLVADQERELPKLRAEQGHLNAEFTRCRTEARQIISVMAEQPGGEGRFVTEHLAELEERAGQIEQRLSHIQRRLADLEGSAVRDGDARAALEGFDPVWDVLTTRERARILGLLLERIDYDGRSGEVSLALRPAGIALLARDAGSDDGHRSPDERWEATV